MAERRYFCGIEGGGTKSTCVICDETGAVLATRGGPCTNQWLIGIDVCAARIVTLIEETMATLGDSVNITPFAAVGLMLSGIDVREEQEKLELRLRELRPDFADKYVMRNDTFAPLGLTSRGSGIVVISGTGSNCRGMNEDGSTKTCGGWGHLLGDEGSAYMIASSVIREIFKRQDEFGGKTWDDDETHRLTAAIASHFDVPSLKGMLAVFYRDFSKDRIASFCSVIADFGRHYGDPLCLDVFRQAGREIADMILGVIHSLPMRFPEDGSKLPVICVGSVWNSFDLLSEGIDTRLREANVSNLVFLRVMSSCAVGAAHLAANAVGVHFEQIDAQMEELYSC